jgi:hypothetical protein
LFTVVRGVCIGRRAFIAPTPARRMPIVGQRTSLRTHSLVWRRCQSARRMNRIGRQKLAFSRLKLYSLPGRNRDQPRVLPHFDQPRLSAADAIRLRSDAIAHLLRPARVCILSLSPVMDRVPELYRVIIDDVLRTLKQEMENYGWDEDTVARKTTKLQQVTQRRGAAMKVRGAQSCAFDGACCCDRNGNRRLMRVSPHATHARSTQRRHAACMHDDALI